MATLDIRLFGGLELETNGQIVPLPQSRKTRALLAFLALKATPQRRDTLCDLLWEIPDDPRAALRWSLSKLRAIVNEEGNECLSADRERVYFAGRDVRVDLLTLEQAHKTGFHAISTDELMQLGSACQGALMAGLELPAQPEFETWRIGQLQRATAIRIHLLEALLERSDNRSAGHGNLLRQMCELDPSSTRNHARLVAHLVATAGLADARQQVEASRRILQDIGPFNDTELLKALQGNAAARSHTSKADATAQQPRTRFLQEIRFCKARDQINLAFAISGSGPPLVKTANWMNHLEFDWESPVWRHLFSALSSTNTLVRYDARGNGLSDWNVSNLGLNTSVEDLKTVVDAAGIERFPLFAISQGCAVAIEFATRWPERVSKMILFGGFAQGWRMRGGAEFREQGNALMKLTQSGWGRDNPAFRQVWTSLFIPNGTPEQLAWFNELQRVTTSPENAAAIIEAHGNLDVTDRLPLVSTPTLVIHSRNDAIVPYKFGREMALGIQNAKFVTLESENHLILDQEPAWPRFLAEITSFLRD